MLWIIQTIIFSIVFIALVHYLFLFFKNNLTVPIVKDLVHSPSNKYENMYNIIHSNRNQNNSNPFENGNSSSTSINSLDYNISDLIPSSSED